MNKQNKILLGILAFVVACTIGYALFSETITINGTATAKGDFIVTATCTPGYLAEANIPTELKLTESGYKDDSCTVVDNTVSYVATLNYPTARRAFTIKITNSGTIPFKFKAITAESGGCYIDGVLQDSCIGMDSNGLAGLDALIYNGTSLDDPTDIILNPGESYYFLASARWTQSQSYGEEEINVTQTQILDFLFEQVTAE